MFAYNRGMASLDKYLDELLSRGRTCFSREEALAALDLSSDAFIAAAARLAKRYRLATPRRGFFLFPPPGERGGGAAQPATPGRMPQPAAAYENSAVRRLGYLLDHCGHARQAKALEPFARKAKS